MVVGRRSFPIGFRKLFRGELLNFGDEHYVYIYIYMFETLWKRKSPNLNMNTLLHNFTRNFPPKASQVCFPNWPQWRGRFMEVQTHQHPKWKVIFQPSIFRRFVSFREAKAPLLVPVSPQQNPRHLINTMGNLQVALHSSLQKTCNSPPMIRKISQLGKWQYLGKLPNVWKFWVVKEKQ